MGATDFRYFSAETDPGEAFRRAVADSKYRHGHIGGTGTIAEKHSYYIATETIHSLAQAEELARQLIDGDDPAGRDARDKWGPAGAIAVGRAEDYVTRDVDAEVKIPGDQGYISPEMIMQFSKVRLRKGEIITSVRTRDRRVEAAKFHRKNAGRRITVYRVYHGDTVIDEYANLEEATAFCEASADKTLAGIETGRGLPGFPRSPYHVEGVILKERTTRGGQIVRSPLVESGVVVKHTLVTATLTVERPKSVPKLGGWLFFGIAGT